MKMTMGHALLSPDVLRLEDVGHLYILSFVYGIMSLNVEPSVNLLSSVIFPLINSARPLQIDKPSPVPS